MASNTGDKLCTLIIAKGVGDYLSNREQIQELNAVVHDSSLSTK